MSILIQEQIHSDLSFIIHTHNPISKNLDEVYIEVAVGLGETLASANQQGTPYRLMYNKKTEACEILAFANYSQGLYANKYSHEPESKLIDYSAIDFSKDPEQLIKLGRRLALVSLQIEKAYGNVPQDIEGAIVYESQSKYSIYIVQTRN